MGFSSRDPNNDVLSFLKLPPPQLDGHCQLNVCQARLGPK